MNISQMLEIQEVAKIVFLTHYWTANHRLSHCLHPKINNLIVCLIWNENIKAKVKWIKSKYFL